MSVGLKLMLNALVQQDMDTFVTMATNMVSFVAISNTNNNNNNNNSYSLLIIIILIKTLIDIYLVFFF